jgi:hypothetical protein
MLSSRTARGAKVTLVREIIELCRDHYEAMDYTSERLKGVDAVIHAIAPLPGKGDQKELLGVRPRAVF